jgi:hypothetical protein
VNETIERLQALDGKEVGVALVQSKLLGGLPVQRTGIFRMFDRQNDGDTPVTRILDAAGVPLVTFRGADMLTIIGPILRVALRATFHVDVQEGPFPPVARPAQLRLNYHLTTREVVPELEAAFRRSLIMRPNAVEEGPLIDNSVRFAVGHASATLRPDGIDAVRLTCIGTSVRDGRQLADLFEPATGARYAFEPDDVVRLGADIRAFLSSRREGFVSYSGVV